MGGHIIPDHGRGTGGGLTRRQLASTTAGTPSILQSAAASVAGTGLSVVVAGTPVSVTVVLQLAYGTLGNISSEIGSGSQVALTGPLPETSVRTAPLVVVPGGGTSVELVANYTMKVNPKQDKLVRRSTCMFESEPRHGPENMRARVWEGACADGKFSVKVF